MSTIEARATTNRTQVAVLTLIASLGFNAFGIYGDGNGHDGALVALLVTGAISTAAVALVFGVVVPKSLNGEHLGRSSMILAVLAVLSIVAFWAGVTPALAAGAIVLGLANPKTLGKVAVGLGAFATVAWIAVYIGDFISTNS